MRHLRPEGHEECDVRIRELEAELAWFKDDNGKLLLRTVDLATRAEKAEARVAELEHAATAMCKMCGKRGIGWWDGNVPGPRCWDHAPTRTEVETRSWHPWEIVALQKRVVAMEKALCDHCGKRWYMFDEFEPAPATVGDETPCEGVQEREAD